MTRVLLFTGGARSDRESAIDALAADHWGHSILVVPTRHEAGERAARIIQSFELPGAWDAAVVSFEDFALGLLREASEFPHEIDEVERRAAIATTLDRLNADGKLDALGEAANSAGFANHVLRVITKLKQAAVEPTKFRDVVAKRQRTSWLDGIVADVYDAYQGTLHSVDVYDRVGVYWRAHVLLSEDKTRYFDRVRHVIFDGFDDFTPSEFRVIEEVARHVDSLAFGLVCDPDATSQRDLYAVPLATRELLRRMFPAMVPHSFSEPPPRNRVAFVTSQLFWRDKPAPPRGIDENLALQPCHDRMNECEWIGRSIKSLIVEQGVAPTDIAVVFRRMENVAPRLRTVLREFQIPATFHTPRTLIDSSFARYLLDMLDATVEWEREAVVDVLVSRWSRAPEERAGAYGYLARVAGVIKGRDEWVSCTRRLRAWLADGTGEQRNSILHRTPDAVSTADSLMEQLAALAERTQDLPSKGTRAEYAGALLQLIANVRPERTIENSEDEALQRFESNAIAAMKAVLRRLRAWGRRLPEGTPIPRSDFQMELREAFAGSAIEEDEHGAGVQLMSAETARHRSYGYLFLGGLNEGEFPAPPAIDAVYSDEDWHDLKNAGANVEQRSRQMDREMLLFHHVLARARSQACITWSVAGQDGRPLARSPFADDVRELMQGGATPVAQTARFLPAPDDVSSPRDLRNAPDLPRDIETAFADTFACTQAGRDVESDRNSRAAFGAYDGVLSERGLLGQLAHAYGPDHAFSAAQLEAYAECPFQFYLERVLNVDPIETPAEEFDPRTRGRILHEALHKFHAEYRGKPVGTIDPAEARETMTRICGEVFDRHARREVTAPRGVVRVERARMQTHLLRYLDLAREDAEAWAPSHFEVGFGRAHATADDPINRPDPFPLKTEDGAILLSGRIDRIDRKDNAARIVDYKTTLTYSAKDVMDGVSLQMPLYAAALETFLMDGTPCEEARLVQPGKRKSEEVMQKQRGKWREREAAMRQGVVRAVAGIRAGQFPPTPHHECCRVCASSRVCRFEQWRIDRKVKDDDSADT